jgi:hypothetical protein
MRVNLNLIKYMDMVNKLLKMVMYMRVIGKITKSME